MRLNIKQQLILAPLLCLILFAITLVATYFSERRLTSLTSVSRTLEQQSMYLQMMFRGINESLLTEGTPDSIAIAETGIASFAGQHQRLLNTVTEPEILQMLKAEIGPGWEELSRAAPPFLRVNDVTSEDDALMIRYGGFLFEGEALLDKVQQLALYSETLALNTARDVSLVVTSTVTLSLFSIVWLFWHLFKVIAVPLNELRTSMLDVTYGEGELLERIDRHRHNLTAMDEVALRHEVNALHHAFQFMLTGVHEHLSSRHQAELALQRLNRELDERVTHRTHELQVANQQMSAEIKQRELTQVALEKARLENVRILEAAGEGIYGADTEGRITFVNPAAAKMLGWESSEMIGQDSHALFHHTQPDGSHYPQEECRVFEVLQGGQPRQIDDELFWRRDGTGFQVEYVAAPVEEAGTLLGVVVVFKDISERKHVEDELRLAANIYQETPFGIMVTDPDGLILRVNRAFTEITGYSVDEALGKTPSLLRSERHDGEFYRLLWDAIKETGSWQGEIWNRRKDGNVFPVWLSINAVRDDQQKIIRYVSVFSDISEKKLSEERIYRLAHYDVLTDLPNRVLFNDQLEQALLQTLRRERSLAVMFLDLDRFKTVNDTLGHPVGDELLSVIAQRIVDLLRPDDVVSRIGGDEFTILLKDISDTETISKLARQILVSIAQPMVLEGHQLHVTASIGVSLYPQDGGDVATLQRNADTAMYQAKAEGKGTYRFYTDAMNQAASERLELEIDLRQAITDNALNLVYQPQVRLQDGQVIGVEALLRWTHPKQGSIGPDRFIPVAEDSGLIVPIGRWVLNTACREYRQWLDKGVAPAGFSVNLSARQFRDPDLQVNVRDALSSYDLSPNHLELELTESCVMDDPEASIAILRELKALGIHVAVDDFGVAYSSLGYLKRLPIDRLKIDRSFISDIPEDTDDAAITATIIAMAHNLGLQVIAEGVETPLQLDFLREKGCDELQGYLFSRPLSNGDLQDLLVQGRRLSAPEHA